jgi:hypothetical protein
MVIPNTTDMQFAARHLVGANFFFFFFPPVCHMGGNRPGSPGRLEEARPFTV